MREIYYWVPWFRELAQAILKAGEVGLINQAKSVNWGGNPPLLRFGEEGIDPFSFMYFLAQKNTTKQRPRVYPSVGTCFGLKSPLPDPDNADFYIFPTPPPPASALFHNGSEYNPTLLWKLFRQAVEDEPQINGTFVKVLGIEYVALKKLTHTLFLINPHYFVPVDVLQHVSTNEGKDLMQCGWNGYQSAMDQAKQTFPACRPYEINRFLFLQYMASPPSLVTPESKFFQVNTRMREVDYWRDFEESHAVYTDKSMLETADAWEEGTIESDDQSAPHPLIEPREGDVIFVRTGSQGRAIGVVHCNDYAEINGLKDRSRIHVYWINKELAKLRDISENEKDFSRIKQHYSTFRAFETAPTYEQTFDLIHKIVPSSTPERSVHPLNLILYGPPGTGKTWRTVTHAVAIVENRSVREAEEEERQDRSVVRDRFGEYRDAGQIAMVTFHQSMGYEDFVEGIRPVLAEVVGVGGNAQAESGHIGEVRYELSQGVFSRIAARARQDPDRRYVLIIDEINRGHVARIFGELITLIEDSKRIGGNDEAWVTLPGSKTDFGVPGNLHIIGTMNTADRSIALLDTALRRRFDFVEMMPDPSHPHVRPDVDGIDCEKLLAAMNRRITVLLDREHQIGHTYFLGIENVKGLAHAFQTRIMPLLQEYFYDDWEKIQAVLNNNGFLRGSRVPEELVRSDLVDSSRTVYELLPTDDPGWTAPERYRAVYELKSRVEDDGAQGSE